MTRSGKADMNTRALTTLEFDKILALCLTHTASELGREELKTLKPSENRAEAELLLAQTMEADTVYRRSGRTPIDGFPDMRGTLKRIHASYSLSAIELLNTAQCLKVSRHTRETILSAQTEGSVQRMANRLSSHRSIEDEIARCILAEDEIADSASVELTRIRRQMRIVNERVREKLNFYIKSSSYQKYLQDPIITMRNGHYAIPIKAEYRSQFPGLIHDQSGSGQTLFIEPSAVVELGNDFKRLLAEEKTEIDRILAGLTALVEPFADELYASLNILGALDAIFAKAILARDMQACCPKLNEEGRIHILNGRHPLLAKDKVVPVSIWLGEEFQTLIITGPNTGGKTVTLKTVGLFVLMALSGMFIPADEGSELSVFHEVFADIGDEQSIEQSLSTFSSHMTNLVDILGKADEHSLVLLDELGAGTDPIEGAALAQAILEYLQLGGCMTMATTHYSEVKAFALTQTGMQNASMEFDVDRLCPTYRLYIGIPGKSNAFEISERLGLEPSVIDRARRYLKKEDIAFEDVLNEASTQRRLATEQREEAEQALAEANKLKTSMQAEKDKLTAEKALLRRKAKEDARELVIETRREMDELIAELKQIKNIDYAALERAKQNARDKLRKKEDALSDKLVRREDHGEPLQTATVGQEVFVVSLDRNATVTKLERGAAIVQAGVMKFTVPMDDLRSASTAQVLEQKRASTPILADVREMKLELDLRGQTVDDAILEIDRYIDECDLSSRKEFFIIHGKGTGALRSGVQAYLKTHPRVKSFRQGAYGEGDAGVTVVSLK